MSITTKLLINFIILYNMEKKTFSKFAIASLKRTAQNVYPLVRVKNKLLENMEEERKKLESIQTQIDGYQAPIKELTGGYTTEDLVERVVTETTKNGKVFKQTSYKLKYPDTVIPPTVPGITLPDDTDVKDPTINDTDNTQVSSEHMDINPNINNNF